jgi:hypothetical protein
MMSPPSLQGSLPAGWLTFTGRELNPLDRDKRFQITVSSSFSGFILAQGKFHDDAPLKLWRPPTPPRFIGQISWMAWMGSRPIQKLPRKCRPPQLQITISRFRLEPRIRRFRSFSTKAGTAALIRRKVLLCRRIKCASYFSSARIEVAGPSPTMSKTVSSNLAPS